MSYEWLSNAGCERCDHLEGVHETEPTRPHPNCLCDILEIPGEDDCIVEVFEEEIGRESFWEEDPPRIVFKFEITARCWNGDVHSAEIEFEADDAYSMDIFDRVEAELEDAKGSVAANCPPCPEDVPLPDLPVS